MSNLIDKVHIKLKKDEFYKGKAKLEKLNIDVVTENITKNCWNYNIQYKIFLKTSNLLIIKLTGKEKTILFKYDIKERVLLKDYEEFLKYLDIYNIEKGVYITTGIFEDTINKSAKNIFSRKGAKSRWD